MLNGAILFKLVLAKVCLSVLNAATIFRLILASVFSVVT